MKKILLLGSGELGKEFVISAQRKGQHIIACDSYAGAPAMQVADECEVFDMLNGEELERIVKKHQPDIIVPEIEAIRTERLYDFEKEWRIVEENPHMIGDFTWAGYDYLGEAGCGIFHYDGGANFSSIYPERTAYIGDLDLLGNRRPISYLREIVYGLRKAPYLAVLRMEHNGQTSSKTPWMFKDNLSSWTWPGFEGQTASVDVYSASEASGHPLKERLHISKKAHLILPTHRILDAAYEAAKGAAKVGTTGKGIGPTYTDKVSRNGVRVGDILHNFEEVYGKAKARHEQILKSLNYEYDITELEKQWLEGIEYLKQFHLVDSEHEINNLLKSGKSVLCEGAQGTMLDVDFGSYPFVTSSNTICAGACTGLGIGPNKIGNVYGIMKAYCTRVGAGPFPTELFDETGKKIRDLGHEYGAVTGRERRCGWIDLVALKYSIMVNGVTQLIMMKSDVLDDFETIKACVAYKVNGEEIDYFPYDISEGLEPVYAELPGWKTDMTKMTSEDEFPEEFNAYVTFLEEQLETPIKIVSVGPDRGQTIERYTEE